MKGGGKLKKNIEVDNEEKCRKRGLRNKKKKFQGCVQRGVVEGKDWTRERKSSRNKKSKCKPKKELRISCFDFFV